MAGRILIVDDDPLLCSLLRMALNREGFETHEVFSGKAALEYLSGTLVDLVLLDVMMADFNGFDVLRMIKADPRLEQVPVILLTARGDGTSLQTGLGIGAVEYLIKPITPDVLVKRVRAVLDAQS